MHTCAPRAPWKPSHPWWNPRPRQDRLPAVATLRGPSVNHPRHRHDNLVTQGQTMNAKNTPYHFTDTLNELDGGVRETAAGAIQTGRTGKVSIELTMKQIGESNQVQLDHKLKFEKPTARGKAGEEETTQTPVWVSQKGLTLMPDTQEKFTFDDQ